MSLIGDHQQLKDKDPVLPVFMFSAPITYLMLINMCQ